MYYLYFTYICPGAESNGYFHGAHSIDSDEVAQVSLHLNMYYLYLPTSVLMLSLMVISTVPTV